VVSNQSDLSLLTWLLLLLEEFSEFSRNHEENRSGSDKSAWKK
jgi:hypothetical protein